MDDETPKLSPAYLIYGTDHPKVRRAVTRLRRRVVAESGSDMNVETVDARDAVVADVLLTADTPTFTLGTRLLVIAGADAWKAADRDRVADWLADPAPGVCLALVGESFRKTERLYKLLDASGQVLHYELPRRQAELADWARKRARAQGARLGASEARHLVTVVGADSEQLDSEIAKLASYADGPVSRDDIDAVCTVAVEARIYELTDAVGRRDTHGAFRILEGLLASGTKPSGEIARSTLYSLVRYVGQLMTVMDLPRGMPAAEVAGTLGIKPYTAQKLLEQRERFERHTLERALAALADAQAEMVGKSVLEPEFTLELALGRVLAAR